MGEDGRFRGEVLSRSKCGSPYDPEDNFCRRCGTGLQRTRVAVRDAGSYACAVGGTRLSPSGAAVVAAGTLAEALLRRVVGPALVRDRRRQGRRQAAKRLPARRQPEGRSRAFRHRQDGDQVVSETIVPAGAPAPLAGPATAGRIVCTRQIPGGRELRPLP
jgi:hypothetical protein